MGWKVARWGYWLVIVVGTVLLFGREQEFRYWATLIVAEPPESRPL
jgi:hypothetical protein